MSIQFHVAVPALRIFDVEKAKAFYVGFLGFAVDWEHRFDDRAPVYMQVSRQGLKLHLTEHHGDCCPGAKVMVQMTGVREYHAELTAKQFGFMRPGCERTFHGSTQVVVIDPFGNRILFNEPDPEPPVTPAPGVTFAPQGSGG